MSAQDLVPLTFRDMSLQPTRETYEALQFAFDMLNRTLFDDRLPNCVITLKNRGRSYGFFAGDRFTRQDGVACDEIALNPVHFQGRHVEETLSTLAHEMVHMWQHHMGKPGRGAYHNKEWSQIMKDIGLQPTDTGMEGGKETGDRMSHMIMPGGAFQRAAKDLVVQGFAIPWAEVDLVTVNATGSEDDTDAPARASKSGKRPKYTCPVCGQNAWAKHGASLKCGEDDQLLVAV